MELFTDLIDAFGKVVGGLKSVNLPQAERKAMRLMLHERRKGDRLL